MKIGREELGHMIRCFFRRKYLLENLKKVHAPDVIIHGAEKSYKLIVKEFKKKHLDIEAYAQSPKGLASYVNHCVEEDTYENNSNRCGRCLNYSYIDTRTPFTMACNIHPETSIAIISCKDFADSGEDFFIRFQKYAQKRCYGCQNFDGPIKIQSMDDLDKDSCLRGCDRLRSICENFTEKV